ncbi:hypothetical protein ACLQ29_22290 [Micromonospora sp. DT228]|uniref:hypothetical protein n=1 Tax=Micromonospora sp. DT228 TaxID=3393443 RepID=UPI003CEA911C
MINRIGHDASAGTAAPTDGSKNIKAAGQADFNDREAQVRPASVLAPRGEAVTHPDAVCPTRSVAGISVLQDGEDVKTSSSPGFPGR